MRTRARAQQHQVNKVDMVDEPNISLNIQNTQITAVSDDGSYSSESDSDTDERKAMKRLSKRTSDPEKRGIK